MGHSKALAAALLALSLSTGCGAARWSLQKAFRSPGERISAFPEEVWAEYDCETQRRPFLMIEENELLPPRLKSGGEFGHRLVYAMCPQRSTEVVRGSLSTRIRFRGEPILRDTVEGYELKPGRWTVDAFIRLPESAEPGVYAYEIAFESRSVSFEKTLTFVVRAP